MGVSCRCEIVIGVYVFHREGSERVLAFGVCCKRTLEPLASHEKKHGLSTEPFPVSAYAGSSKNLKDTEGLVMRTHCARAGIPTLYRGISLIRNNPLPGPYRRRPLRAC